MFQLKNRCLISQRCGETKLLPRDLFIKNFFYILFSIICLTVSWNASAKSNVKAAIEINTCPDLQNINNNLNAQYILVADIDCTGINFIPIGNGYPFLGGLNGAGHTIKNLLINAADSSGRVGLFGATYGAQISQLTLENVKISGNGVTGALVGSATNTTIYKVQVQGGNVGVASTTGHNTGGLVGGMSDGSIEDSSASVIVGGADGLGGLVGGMSNASITRSYATGSVTSGSSTGSFLGGLVGSTSGSLVADSYATGSVSGSGAYIGGLIGEVYNSVNILVVSNCYATGAVTGNVTTNTGGLIGGEDGPLNVVSSYWDTQTTRQRKSAAGTGKTTAEMYQQATYVSWDFANIWNINEGKSYPWLLSSQYKVGGRP